MIVKNRWVRMLTWLCTACLLFNQGATAGLAEMGGTDENSGIGDYQAFVVDGNDMYVQAEDGIWHRNLSDQKEERLVTYSVMDSLWEINSCFSLFVWDHRLAVADWDHGKLWRWNGSAFERLNTLQGIEGIDQSYFINVASQGDVLWVLNNGVLRAWDLLTGSVSSTNAIGVSEIAADPEGGIVAIRRFGDQMEVVNIPSPTANPIVLAQLSSALDGGLACDGSTGTVYAAVSGALSRLDGDQWTALRPLSHSFGWRSCAVYADGFAYADNNELYFLPFSAPVDSVRLTIRGMNWLAEDDQGFMTENPSISLYRQSANHYCAQEIYQAIAARDDSTDLFFVTMSSGVRNLMEKGYLQAIAPSDVLNRDAARLYDFASNSCRYNGEIYAYPADLMLGAWTVKSGFENIAPPSTLTELIQFAQKWEQEDGSIPAVAPAYSNQAWTRKDYAVYALKQDIMLQYGNGFRFQAPALTEALEQCGLLEESAPSDGNEPDTARNAVFTVEDYNALSGDAADECALISPPALKNGAEVAIPANMLVYVINPYSTHRAEAVAYLEYLANNRSATATASLCRDATATLLPSSAEADAQLAEQISQAQEALDQCQPEDQPACMETLNTLLAEKQQMDADNYRWIVHPDALKKYQTLYAPNINLQLTPLLESSGKSHTDIWSMLVECLDVWLAGQCTVEQCLAKMDTITSSYIQEQ